MLATVLRFASCKLQRAVALPLLQTTSVKCILAKHFSNKSSKDDDETRNLDYKFIKCCLCCPSGGQPNLINYDDRKYGHCLPQYNRCPDFEPLHKIPTDVFRNTIGERLGPQGQAGKCCHYLNPEYFSFHHMTYYDMHSALRQFRKHCPKTERKP